MGKHVIIASRLPEFRERTDRSPCTCVSSFTNKLHELNSSIKGRRTKINVDVGLLKLVFSQAPFST